MKNLTGESMNITEENLKAMQQLFPEAFEEGKIDFDVLRQLLGDFVDDEQERYSFKWNGKGKALRLSQTPSMGTLRPCKEESKNWDNTENLYIEGDNLEVLKLLQKSYYGKVKMIYIDPPYNTGGDFVYKDNFHDNIQNYKEITGQVDGEGNKIDTNTESNGRFHTDWLNMMYPRLRLARNLLTDDGVIFISIDDNEQENLKRLCDEIFGADNFIAQLVWEKKKKGSFLSNDITNVKEYVLVYVKNKTSFSGLIGEITSAVETYPCINAVNKRELRKIPAGISSKYKEKDFFMAKGTEISDTTMSIVLHSDLVIKDGVLDKELILEGNWRYSQNAMEEYAEENKLYITRDLYLRRIVDEVRNKTLKDLLPRVGSDNDVSYKDDINIMNLNTSGWGSNEDADEELRLLFGVQKLLEYPKPSRLIAKLLVSYRNTSDDIFLDFFSGSATTAHAVMNLNAEDGGHRKFIMVQLPEPTDKKSEAYKAGYKNICEIGKERIRRAGDKIKAEAGDKAADLDIGFKVFKLDSSNLQKWKPQPDDLVMTLQQATDNFLPDRTEQDVLYEIMLKMGLELTCQIEEEQAAGETVYIIGGGALMICLGRNITTAVAEAVVKLHEEYESELWQVVFRDTGFASDMDKTNVKETLKVAGLDEDSFVCV